MIRNRYLLTCLIPAALTFAACGDDGSETGASGETEATTADTESGADPTGETDPGETDPSGETDPDTTDTDTDTDGETEGDTDGGELVVPDTYEFESRFEEGVSSVAYGGQTFRQVLISSLKSEMGLIQTEIDRGTIFEEGQVAARLSFYVDFDGETSSEVPHLVATTPAPLQTVFGDLGSGSNLVDKIAGNDADPQHQDWSSDMIGWDASDNPEDLVRDWIEACDALAVAYSSGDIPVDPDGVQIATWFVSAEGLDYQQLLQKFLLGAVNYSQGTDDYLDDASDNGINSDNTMPDDGAPYTSLEHQWDEGFGYWGASRNYLEYEDGEIATSEGRPEFVDGYNDANGDDAIDLQSEINFAASVNAGKRDVGAAALGAPTDYTAQTMQAFLTGRAIITHADGALSDEDFAMLQEQRDIAVDGWERSLAATAIHYFNDTIKDTLADEYSFADHTKHWGELKGFLLALQFNPRAQVSDEDLQTIHEMVGTAPLFPTDSGVAQYIADLVAARNMLAEAYAFDDALIGDDFGENGW
ncbi:MAG: DUF4856 domain-containing protein [Nannocystaceae bacterium]|nr:DUF4856 domain-containing protein [bacterium]